MPHEKTEYRRRETGQHALCKRSIRAKSRVFDRGPDADPAFIGINLSALKTSRGKILADFLFRVS